jgi:hypothetical protein
MHATRCPDRESVQASPGLSRQNGSSCVRTSGFSSILGSGFLCISHIRGNCGSWLTDWQISRAPPRAAGRSPRAQRRGVGCNRGWTARHATPDCGWPAAAPFRERRSRQSHFHHTRPRCYARDPSHLRAERAQQGLNGLYKPTAVGHGVAAGRHRILPATQTGGVFW